MRRKTTAGQKSQGEQRHTVKRASLAQTTHHADVVHRQDALELGNSVGAGAAEGNRNVTMQASISTLPAGVECAAQDRVRLLAKVRARLERLGIALAEFLHFVERFIGHRFDFIVRRPGTTWRLVRRQFLTDAHLVAHLAGDLLVGTGCPWVAAARQLRTRFLVVDLDHGGSGADLLDRYDRVVGALGAPSQLFRSSESGGLHLYYHFTRPSSLHLLRTPDGASGAVVRLLGAQDLREQPGQIELYPRGQYKGRGVQPRLRAPFGSGSRLLDRATLQPVAGPGAAANLAASRRMFEDGDAHLIDPDELVARSHAAPSAPKSEPDRPASATSRRALARRGDGAPCGHDAAYVTLLLNVGLTRAGELNAAASALAYHMRFGLALDQDVAEARLVQWLDTRHNGQSRTLNANPARARREVLGVLHRVYGNLKLKHWASLPGLSAFEVQALLDALASDQAACDPATGEVLDRYKLERYGFELLRLAKQWVLTALGDKMRAAAMASPGDSRATLIGVMHAAKRLQPNWTCPEFVAPVPAELRQGRRRSGQRFLRGIGRDHRWALWRALQEAGVFRLEQLSSRHAHRAATYRVTFDFGALSPDTDTEFTHLDGALRSLLSPQELGARYSDYRARRLRESVAGQMRELADAENYGVYRRLRRGLIEGRRTAAEDDPRAA